MLAIGRRSQQAIDHASVSLGGLVGQKGRDFLGRWRQTGQIERDSTNERPLIGRWSGRHLPLFELGENKSIDFGLDPIGLLDLRRDRTSEFLKRPELLLRVGEFVGLRSLGCPLGRSGRGRPGHAQHHPLGKQVDLSLLELAIGRHLQRVFVLNRFDDQAFFQVACDGRGTAVAATQNRRPRREFQTAFGILAFTVALVAPLDQQRPNVAFEEFDRLGIELRRFRVGRVRQCPAGRAQDRQQPPQRRHACRNSKGRKRSGGRAEEIFADISHMG